MEVHLAEFGGFLVNFDFVDERFGFAVVDVVLGEERLGLGMRK